MEERWLPMIEKNGLIPFLSNSNQSNFIHPRPLHRDAPRLRRSEVQEAI